jgi:hypothetical protein
MPLLLPEPWPFECRPWCGGWLPFWTEAPEGEVVLVVDPLPPACCCCWPGFDR